MKSSTKVITWALAMSAFFLSPSAGNTCAFGFCCQMWGRCGDSYPSRQRSYSAWGEQGRSITCSGILIDVWMQDNADWPLAVIHSTANNRTCTFNRGHAGHDPLRPCTAGEMCTLVGVFRRELGFDSDKTYAIERIMSVHQGPDQ